MNIDQFLTPPQAAKELGVSNSLIRRYCREGRLGYKIGGRYLIPRAQLKEFQTKPRKVGRPPQKSGA